MYTISHSISEAMEDLKRWEDMATGCLLNIFQRLALEDLTLAVPFVCRSWHRASLDSFCWRILDFRTSCFSPESKFARRFEAAYALPSFSFTGFMKLCAHRSCKQAVELRFPVFYRASIDDLVLASKECPRLKTLAMPNLTTEDELRVPQLIRNWRDLERLEVELKPSCFSELMEQIGVNCGKFRALTVSGSILRTDALAIVDFTPKIKCLDLSRSYLPKEQLLMILKGCEEIERLSVNDCIGFQVDRDVLEMASKIRYFEHQGSKLWDYYVCDDPFNWIELYIP